MSWNLHYGNKGYIFSLDAAIAIFIVMIVLVSSFLLITRNNVESYSLLQNVKISNDLFTVLDINEDLDSLNKNTISNNIESILMENLNYTFRFECQNKIIQKSKFPIGSAISGERILAIDDYMNFCIARYWVWPK